MTATIDLITEQHSQSLAVPGDAVLSDINNNAFVFIVDKDTIAHKKIVQVGISSNGKTEIVNGIDENQLLVIKGQERLKEGKKAKIIPQQKKKK